MTAPINRNGCENMSDTQAPRKRGRPTTGQAKSAKRRMELTRLRAREALNAEDPDLSAVSTTGLLEALRVAYRDAMARNMAEVTRELFKRANERTSSPVAVSFRDARDADNSATVAIIPDRDSATVAEIESTEAKAISATVAEINEPTEAKKTHYPPEIKRQAAEMFDAGTPKDAVITWIEATTARPFNRTNFARFCKQGRALAKG